MTEIFSARCHRWPAMPRIAYKSDPQSAASFSGYSMNRSFLLASAVLVLAGCASVQHTPMTAESSEALRGKTIVVTRHEAPGFNAMTAGKAAFGMIGAAAMVAAGNKIVAENEIPNPAIAIADRLAQRLEADRGMVVRDNGGKIADNDKVPTLQSTYPGADYLLDVRTLSWGFFYYPTNWDNYRVMSGYRLRLIDAATGKVVAESACSATEGDDANPPTRDQLLADEAALLKSYFEASTTRCVDLMSKEILAL
jgi:hypothetical protein